MTEKGKKDIILKLAKNSVIFSFISRIKIPLIEIWSQNFSFFFPSKVCNSNKFLLEANLAQACAVWHWIVKGWEAIRIIRPDFCSCMTKNLQYGANSGWFEQTGRDWDRNDSYKQLLQIGIWSAEKKIQKMM